MWLASRMTLTTMPASDDAGLDPFMKQASFTAPACVGVRGVDSAVLTEATATARTMMSLKPTVGRSPDALRLLPNAPYRRLAGLVAQRLLVAAMEHVLDSGDAGRVRAA